MKEGLSPWSDEVVSLHFTETSLQTQVVTLNDRCLDMEGRMTRININISIIYKEVKRDHSHRASAPRKLEDHGKPRVIRRPKRRRV